MDAQNPNQSTTGEPRDKFPEPRGWALKWDGFVPGAATPETSPTAAEEPQPTNVVWDKFPEPRGWAANWDGAALGDLQGRQNGRVS
jgi:hypothetical protein